MVFLIIYYNKINEKGASNLYQQNKYYKQEMMESEETIDPNCKPKCRICWEQNGKKISPCHCAGSMAYIHEDCLKTWIEKSVQKGNRQTSYKANGYTSINCELCKGEIEFKMIKSPACLGREEIKQKIKQNKGSFFVMICVLLGLAVIGVVLLLEGISDLILKTYTIWGIIFLFSFVILVFALQIRFFYGFIITFFRGNEYKIYDFRLGNP